MGNELSADIKSQRKHVDVNLSKRELKSLPSEIKCLAKHCLKLDVSYNKMLELPAELGLYLGSCALANSILIV